jgi:RNA polymerase sigma-70 factor (ECF subfamily)
MTTAPAPSTSQDRRSDENLSANDDDLLVWAGRGDKGAFSGLYAKTAPRVLGLVKRVLVDTAQAEEVTQEVFLEAWQHAARFAPEKGRALSWLLTMAHRRAIDRVRSSQASRDRDLATGIRDYEESRDDLQDTVETTIEGQRVRRAMLALTEFQRQALNLTYFKGLTNGEAARIAGVPIGTMKSRLHEALVRLRMLMTTDDATER